MANMGGDSTPSWKKESKAWPLPIRKIPAISANLKCSPNVKRDSTMAITGVPSTDRLASQAGTRSNIVIHSHQETA